MQHRHGCAGKPNPLDKRRDVPRGAGEDGYRVAMPNARLTEPTCYAACLPLDLVPGRLGQAIGVSGDKPPLAIVGTLHEGCHEFVHRASPAETRSCSGKLAATGSVGCWSLSVTTRCRSPRVRHENTSSLSRVTPSRDR